MVVPGVRSVLAASLALVVCRNVWCMSTDAGMHQHGTPKAELAQNGVKSVFVSLVHLYSACLLLHTFSDLCLFQAAAGGPSSRGEAGGKKSSDPNEFWWDVAGWVVLATIIVGAVAVARSSSGAKA